MGDIRLGVDYGTSNTVAMLAVNGDAAEPLLFHGTPLLPSAVYAEADGRLLVGRDARRAARADPVRFEPNPKRRIDDREVLLGERVVRIVDLVTATLRQVAQEAYRVAGRAVEELTMTCPVEWGPARRAVLTGAAAAVGLPVPTLVPEPVAAATYFAATLGRRVNPGQSVVVYDLGGGTFDACVVRRGRRGFEPLAYRGLDNFGGVDLDQIVVDQIRDAVAPGTPELWQRLSRPSSVTDRRAFRSLWDDARAAKESLSEQPTASLFVPLLDRDVHVAREHFERAAAPELRSTVQVTMGTIRAAHVEPGEVAGVFLVGGSTRVPMVATLLHQATGIAPTVIDQPETVVARGALTATGQQATEVVPPAAPDPLPPPPPPPGGKPPAGTVPDVVAPAGTVPGEVAPGVVAQPSLLRVPAGALLHAVAVVLTVLGFVLLVGAQLAPPVDFGWLRLGTVVGGVLAAAGGALLWRAPRFPLIGRLLAPALPLALVALWDDVAANGSGAEHGGFTFVASGDWYSYYTDSFPNGPTAGTLQFPSYVLLALAVLCVILAAVTVVVRNAHGTRR